MTREKEKMQGIPMAHFIIFSEVYRLALGNERSSERVTQGPGF